MNKIKINQLIIAGVITLLVFIMIEFLLERVIGQFLFGTMLEDWHQGLAIPQWRAANSLLNLLIALLNTTMLIWLYAALRPMFGVGVKTALITSLFGFVFVFAFAINSANIGIYPWPIAFLETGYLMVELPLSIIAGAYFYERD